MGESIFMLVARFFGIFICLQDFLISLLKHENLKARGKSEQERSKHFISTCINKNKKMDMPHLSHVEIRGGYKENHL